MRVLVYSLIALMLPAVALGAIKTRVDVVQKGVFEEVGCEHNPADFANACKCKADIERLQVTDGVSDDVKAKINLLLKGEIGNPPKKLEEGDNSFCIGRPSSASREENITTVDREMRMLYQDDMLATFIAKGYYYPAGAAHGIYGNTYVMTNLSDGSAFEPFMYMSKKQIAALNRYIRSMIRTKHAKEVFEEELTRSKPYITAEGCEGCNLFYSGNGWEVEFQLYSIAPYVVGMITMVVPESVLPSPKKLIAGK